MKLNAVNVTRQCLPLVASISVYVHAHSQVTLASWYVRKISTIPQTVFSVAVLAIFSARSDCFPASK